jgi:hypothetical protein
MPIYLKLFSFWHRRKVEFSRSTFWLCFTVQTRCLHLFSMKTTEDKWRLMKTKDTSIFMCFICILLNSPLIILLPEPQATSHFHFLLLNSSISSLELSIFGQYSTKPWGVWTYSLALSRKITGIKSFRGRLELYNCMRTFLCLTLKLCGRHRFSGEQTQVFWIRYTIVIPWKHTRDPLGCIFLKMRWTCLWQLSILPHIWSWWSYCCSSIWRSWKRAVNRCQSSYSLRIDVLDERLKHSRATQTTLR